MVALGRRLPPGAAELLLARHSSPLGIELNRVKLERLGSARIEAGPQLDASDSMWESHCLAAAQQAIVVVVVV